MIAAAFIAGVDAPASRPRHVTRLALSGQSIEFVERQFTMNDLLSLVAEMHSLSDDLFAHLGRCIELLGTTKEAEQPLRQIAVGPTSPVLPKGD